MILLFLIILMPKDRPGTISVEHLRKEQHQKSIKKQKQKPYPYKTVDRRDDYIKSIFQEIKNY